MQASEDRTYLYLVTPSDYEYATSLSTYYCEAGDGTDLDTFLIGSEGECVAQCQADFGAYSGHKCNAQVESGALARSGSGLRQSEGSELQYGFGARKDSPGAREHRSP